MHSLVLNIINEDIFATSNILAEHVGKENLRLV